MILIFFCFYIIHLSFIYFRLLGPAGSPEVRIELDNFKPGSVIAFRFKLNQMQSDACDGLQKLLCNLRFSRNLQEIIENLTLKDLNHVLFKCEQEEKDGDPQRGVYNLEGYGNLKYAGLQVNEHCQYFPFIVSWIFLCTILETTYT